MLLISMYCYFFGSGTSVDLLNSKIDKPRLTFYMVGLSCCQYHQKSTNTMFFIIYDKGLFPLFELKTFLTCILITANVAGSSI